MGADTLGYVRVSTEQQATDDKSSLPDQRRLLVERAASLGRVLDPGYIFEDPGASGATAEGRPGFMSMLSYAEANQRSDKSPGMIFVLNDSRFGRFTDPEEATYWRVVLKRLGWGVRFCEQDEVEDPVARGVIRFIGSAQASEYRANLCRTNQRAVRSSAAKGLWITKAPLGYRRLATRKDGATRVLETGQCKAEDEVSRLTLGPQHEQDLIRWIFETYANGTHSMSSLVRALKEKFPGKRWSVPVLGVFLRNPVYVGDLCWCRSRIVKNTRHQRDRSEWVIVRDAHSAIVSRELWNACEERRALNKIQRRATVGGYPLSGMIRCLQCGSFLCGGGGASGPAHDLERYRIYLEAAARTPGVCSGKATTIRKMWLEGAVIDAVSDVVSKPETQAVIKRTVREFMQNSRAGTSDRRVALERERDSLFLRRRRLMQAVENGLFTNDETIASLADLRSRVAVIDEELSRIRFAGKATDAMEGEMQRMVKLAQDFPTQARRLSGAALREVIKPWIADAYVDKNTRTLHLTLWRVPGADKVLLLNTSPEQD